ncbi:MAG: AMP-binding protein, partial [Microcoleus sp. SIO2G3]|nr:AMP-binding protein [Microcoleus sp. SIO2G3]
PLSPEELADACLPPGQIGEIVVSGNHVLSGYLHGRGDADIKLRVGDRVWHRTGDAGCFDGQGRLWLLGRCGARIQDEFGVLYPFAVEAAVSQHSEIRRSALVQIQSQRWLVIEAESPVNLHQLQQDLSWAQLHQIRQIRQIPVDRRHNAKIDYSALRKLCQNWHTVSSKTP